ncbi:MAG: relaxase/mobilization nuclease domain-containing protein [Firmicutes bacterium]|nr:relaxase/mobilization nuclease domain-containing protein [Bacillota bacterium]
MKIVPIKQSTHLESVINYIENPDKTEQMLYVTGYMCDTDATVSDFKVIFDKAMKKGNNLAHHLMIGFSPSDKIDQETALQIAEEVMRRMYPNNPRRYTAIFSPCMSCVKYATSCAESGIYQLSKRTAFKRKRLCERLLMRR